MDCTANFGGGAYVERNVIQEDGVMEHLGVVKSIAGPICPDPNPKFSV